MEQNTSLLPYLKQAASVANRAKDMFQNLNINQLNFRPDPKAWSIAECLDHLIQTNLGYLPQLEKTIQKKGAKSIWEKMKFMTNTTGKMLLKVVEPERRKKAKTFKLFYPKSRNFSSRILSDFIENHIVIKEKISLIQTIDYSDIVVTSPVNKMITLKAGVLCKVLLLHTERHLNQASEILDHPTFPKA